MRYLVGVVLVIVDFALGALLGTMVGAGAEAVYEGPETSANAEFAVGITFFLIVGLAVAVILGKLELTFFRRRFTECIHCLSYIRIGATKCPYCRGTNEGIDGSGGEATGR